MLLVRSGEPADTERSKSKNNLHEPPWYEKRVKEMELENYVPQPDIQVRWRPEMEGGGGEVAIIDNPTWWKEKRDRSGKVTGGTWEQCHASKPTGL